MRLIAGCQLHNQLAEQEHGVLQVSAMMKKHLVEGVVPVLIELKCTLEGLRHWLLGDLLTCIRALLKDHKNEVCLVFKTEKTVGAQQLL